MPTTTFDHKYYPGDANGITFLAALAAVEGDQTYGDASAVGDFAQATAALNSAIRAEAIAFWTTGVPDAGSTTAKTGLSATTPYEFFEAFHNASAAAGTWRYADGIGQTGTTVTGMNFAKGLRALGTAFTAVWSWLMSFTSNSSNRTSATASPSDISGGITGTYDPTICLARTLIATTKMEAAGTKYEWATVGLLAAFQSVGNAGALKNAKDTLAVPRIRYDKPTPARAETDNLGLRGRSGLSYQVSFTEGIGGAPRRVRDVVSAAMLMAAYRNTPQLWNLKDH